MLCIFAWKYLNVQAGNTWVTTNASQRRQIIENYPQRTNAVGWNINGDLSSAPCHALDVKCGRTPARCIDRECRLLTETPHSAMIYEGPQFAFISREFGEYLQHDPLSIAWQEFFRWTDISDEHFFPSENCFCSFVEDAYTISAVLYASPYANRAISTTKNIYIEWQQEHCSTDHLWGPHPCRFSVEDLEFILEQKTPFIRKIVPGSPLRSILGSGKPIVSLP